MFSDGAQLAQGFPTEPRLTDGEKGTQQCLALEHRGCANWTSGSVASVQINREAAQESSGAVRGIGEPSHPLQHSEAHAHRQGTPAEMLTKCSIVLALWLLMLTADF